MYSDCHLHTDFSADSDTPAEAQIDRAIALGMERLCITDHMDMDFPDTYGLDFTFPTDRYFQRLEKLRRLYGEKISLAAGVELGLKTELGRKLEAYVRQWPFDYVIGSVHLVRDMDPYYPAFYESRGEEEAYREYFECTLENVRLNYDFFDSLGHLDYIVRYGPNKNRNYSYERYRDIIDEILKLLVAHGKALECNTAGLSYGLGYPHPHPNIIRRYLELGGEMITLGSDAHVPENVGYAFTQLKELLEGCGAKYYTEFHRRQAVFYQL